MSIKSRLKEANKRKEWYKNTSRTKPTETLTIEKINNLYKALLSSKDTPTQYIDHEGVHKIEVKKRK